MKYKTYPLASVAQWIECWPANQRVACLGCWVGPQLGVCKGQQHTDISLPLFLPPFSSL